MAIEASGIDPAANAWIDCGWGRLIFAHTFPDMRELIRLLRQEKAGQRDIAFYLNDPHVVLSMAPHELFLDPSHTFRLALADYRPGPPRTGFEVAPPRRRSDADAINRIYAARSMVQIDPEFLWDRRDSPILVNLVAVDGASGRVIGS